MRKANNEYRKRNPIKVKYASKKATCKGKGIDFEISAEDFVDWYSAQPKTCHYCGREFKDKFDTKIDRKDARGGYRPGNLVLACFMCNRLKSDIFTEEEWFEIVQKYNLVRRYK
ncbi:MAG: Restriction endonuclease PacI [Candidatus Uhrbacteria bacterium GW2011_GWF2_44_350]|uniref:Restriction endonuclease PacI n=1 Tax=Candidatus Uhrbacteria bacterium GW2011_GWF2_44_350 TaxID=1619000 RepID=A0A0G1JA27_9BACT|nr:MAG: Restriction endonuclease PacI [Candidatus Uhrbacteria bacterium GW2011_GWF2_44_350]